MCNRTIVTGNKSNRLKDLPKREQDTASSVFITSERDTGVKTASVHPIKSSVESTSLTERKTDYRNGITLKTALIGGRSNEQATKPHAVCGTIASEA